MPIYPLDHATEVMRAFRDYMQNAPEDMMGLGVFWSASDDPRVSEKYRGTPVIILLACYTGPFEKGEEVIAPSRELGKPIADLIAPMTWVEAQKFPDADYPDGAFYYWTSIYMDRLDDEVIRALAYHTHSRPPTDIIHRCLDAGRSDESRQLDGHGLL